MFSLLYPLMISIVGLYQEPWAPQLDSSDGLTYIQVAEDLIAEGNLTNASRNLITELYVLAAVTDSTYRDSAILGIISVITDEELIHQLQNIRVVTPLLVTSVVYSHQSSYNQSGETIDSLCEILITLRQGKPISTEQAMMLRPWAFMFQNSFDMLFQSVQRRRRPLQKPEMDTTLKVELAILGGPTLWSADMAATGGHPVVVSMSDDIATLLSVDPTKRWRKNGQWVVE